MRSRYRKILIAAGAALASMALLASAAQAAKPAPPYEDFAGCPSEAENEFVAFCVKYEFTGGHFQLGKRTVPVTNPIVLRGASRRSTGAFLSNSEGGIVPVRQPVPGGLVGITGYKWLDELIESSELLKLYATVELAGQPGQLSTFPLSLPIKIHLENPLLGSGCHVGSDAAPIQLNLITGTTSPPAPNQPITGQEPSEFEEEESRPKVLVSSGGFVDNSFAVPGASGCTLNLGGYPINIDSAIDKAAALPSPAGTNEAVLDFRHSIVRPAVVYP
jgi:hypothetical protein